MALERIATGVECHLWILHEQELVERRRGLRHAHRGESLGNIRADLAVLDRHDHLARAPTGVVDRRLDAQHLLDLRLEGEPHRRRDDPKHHDDRQQHPQPREASAGLLAPREAMLVNPPGVFPASRGPIACGVVGGVVGGGRLCPGFAAALWS